VALLLVAGVIEDQHPTQITDPVAVGAGERVDCVPTHVVTSGVGVPDRLAQQPLHRLRRHVPGVLSQLPTRPRVHIGQ
jgi:hypothetical protein